MKIPSALAAAFAVVCPSILSAATVTWTAGGVGNIGDSTKYAGGVAPVNTDTVVSDGTGSTIGFDNTNTGLSLTALNLNVTSGATIFNQTAGTFTVGTLGFGGAGGSRNPTYNLSGGTLNISTAFTWSNGSNSNFNVSGGTVNYSGTGLSLGVAGGARGYITMTGGVFNANSVTQINLGNAGSGNGQGYLNLSGNAQFSATGATNGLVVGQLGSGTTNANSFGRLTVADTATVAAPKVVLGGANAASFVWGEVLLNGGSISTGSIRKGSSNFASDSTRNFLNANGGTIIVTNHADNAGFFGAGAGSSIYVNIQAGGLNLNTNGNATGIDASTTIAGIGDFVKQGAGALTVFGAKTYTGDTVIEGGSIVLGNSNVFADASDLVLDGGALALADFSEAFSTLNLESTSTLDFGTLIGGANTLTFADSSAVAWSGSLILTNFNVAEDFLNFSSATGLTIGQLSAISLEGFNATGLDGFGNVVFTAVPEPSEISLAIAAGLGLVAFARRRRRAARA